MKSQFTNDRQNDCELMLDELEAVSGGAQPGRQWIELESFQFGVGRSTGGNPGLAYRLGELMF